MANRTQQNPVVSSDEWYTPRWVIDELGPFDLDPCAPMQPPYEIAPLSFNQEQDGLSQTCALYHRVLWLPVTPKAITATAATGAVVEPRSTTTSSPTTEAVPHALVRDRPPNLTNGWICATMSSTTMAAMAAMAVKV